MKQSSKLKGDFILADNHASQRETLWQEWLILQASSQEALLKGTAHYFTCIRQAICDKLALDALTSGRLGQKDEEVYNHLVYLMDTYRDVIHLFTNPPCDPASDLVAGLCDILNSRLKQFEDAAIGQENPVLNEKLGIIEKAIIHTTRQIEDLEQSYVEESIQSLHNDILTGRTDTAWQNLQISVLEKNLPVLQSHYQENLNRTLASIDDLHARKTAGYYTDLLEREWEVLGLIIQVQVKAIETLCPNPDDSGPILSKLREAYQQTGPVVSGFRKLIQNAPPSSLLEESFSSEWLASQLNHPPAIELDVQPLISSLMHEAGIIFDQLRCEHLGTAKDLHKIFDDELSLSDETIDAFEKAEYWLATMPESNALQASNEHPREDNTEPILDEIGGNAKEPALEEAKERTDSDLGEISDEPDGISNIPDKIINSNNTDDESSKLSTEEVPEEEITEVELSINPPNQESEIMSGITETLQIKIESLKESLELFKENSTDLLYALFSGITPPTDQDIQDTGNQIFSCWCTDTPSQENIDIFFQECISLSPFAAFNEKIAKSITANTAKIEKAIFRFRKETLLYEISTYEEILYYSVSRLRESELPHIVSAVKIMDETFQSLEALLADKGIAIIHPTPHEPFNGREHEILTAEEQDGFAKGEIIKTMTSGYKANDQVILRANVVAAR